MGINLKNKTQRKLLIILAIFGIIFYFGLMYLTKSRQIYKDSIKTVKENKIINNYFGNIKNITLSTYRETGYMLLFIFSIEGSKQNGKIWLEYRLLSGTYSIANFAIKNKISNEIIYIEKIDSINPMFF